MKIKILFGIENRNPRRITIENSIFIRWKVFSRYLELRAMKMKRMNFAVFLISIISIWNDNVSSTAPSSNTLSPSNETFLSCQFFVSMTKLVLTIGVYCSTPAVTHYINQSKNIRLINYATKCVSACVATLYFSST